jgi:hypothetical protein
MMTQSGAQTATVNQQLQKIFARQEFQDQPSESLNQLPEWIHGFFRWLSTLIDDSPVLFWVILISCLVVLISLFLHMGLTVYRVFHLEQAQQQREGKTARQLRSTRFVRQAEECVQKEEYTDAIRCLFLALVYHFDENEEFAFRPALTNREYLLGFVDRPSLAQQLTGFVDVLDQHWYGMMPCSQATYQECRSVFDQLVR